MEDRDLAWRLLPFIVILLVGSALLFPGCAELRDGLGKTDFWSVRDKSQY